MDRAEPPRPVPSRSAPTGGPTFADEVAFLRDCAFPGEEVEVVETHLSWVVLTADRAHKLKRPVVQPYLDHRRLSARLADCRAEVALNQALAPGVYLGLESLRVDAAGELHLGGDGTVVDWLVVMRRLDREQLLDRRIAAGTATTAELDPVVELLADFYRSQVPQAHTPATPSAGGDGGAASAGGNCDMPGDNESFEQFQARCAEQPAQPEASCDLPGDNETFEQFQARCNAEPAPEATQDAAAQGDASEQGAAAQGDASAETASD